MFHHYNYKIFNKFQLNQYYPNMAYLFRHSADFRRHNNNLNWINHNKNLHRQIKVDGEILHKQ